MHVRSKMTKEPVTITKQTTIADALELMRKHNIRRLPVLENDKLVGIVTDRDLSEVSPSPATSLSVFEINYLLAKMKIKDALPKKQKVITIEPDAYVEEAAIKMREHKIGALPVVEQDKLVGIITETNIFDAFIDLLGVREQGSRIDIEVEDHPGVLANVTQLIQKSGANISRVAVFREEGKTFLVIRLTTFYGEPIIKTLEESGYKVVAYKSYNDYQ
ncbi:CBS and ACT domain-containing protein [Dehalobacterium formicoaceticum]|uniref:CBS and ACT domain-containing protein n=1 Tax=Dehalobacterium formicoaceticum TaxID=51515 RepID=A0ABT1Y3Y2_9FIRM|nr:CBS and ACT domain-containing protein [Dehalobacterium formicoaceticum]MCR6545582.1 CBS and ACT domain-containing protein [Dehalobacterium formicoaceticum]